MAVLLFRHYILYIKYKAYTKQVYTITLQFMNPDKIYHVMNKLLTNDNFKFYNIFFIFVIYEFII